MGNSTSSRKKREISAEEKVFQNELLLENILSFLTTLELLQFRLVNNLWKKTVERQLQQKHFQVKLKLYPRYYHKHDYMARRLKENLKDQSYVLPFTNFSIDVDNKEMDVDVLMYKYLESLPSVIRRSAKKVTLYYHSNPWTFMSNAEYPRLESLSLNFTSSFGSYSLDSSPLSFSSCIEENPISIFAEIVKQSPVLNSLTLSCFYPKHRDADVFISSFLDQIKHPEIRKIKHLKLNYVQSKHLRKIQKLNLQLKSLYVYFDQEDCVPILKEILTRQSRSLGTLEIGYSGVLRKTVWSTWCPYMQQLKTLRLYRVIETGKDRESHKPKRSSNYTLVLSQNCVPTTKLSNCAWENVTSIELPAISEQDAEELLWDLTPAFPNVQKLKIWSSLLWRFLAETNLNKLKVLEIQNNSWKSSADCDNYFIEVAEEEEQVCARFFKNLGLLTLTNFKLTDFGIVAILPYLKSLRILDLWESPYCEITEHLVQRMRDKFSVYVRSKSLIKA